MKYFLNFFILNFLIFLKEHLHSCPFFQQVLFALGLNFLNMTWEIVQDLALLLFLASSLTTSALSFVLNHTWLFAFQFWVLHLFLAFAIAITFY